jgi:hypothetical protein
MLFSLSDTQFFIDLILQSNATKMHDKIWRFSLSAMDVGKSE